MLIVKSHGRVALNLDHVMNIEVPFYCPCDVVARVPAHYVDYELQDAIRCGTISWQLPKFHLLHLGTYHNEEEATKVLADLIEAYEKGAKVFRMPEELG